MFKFTSLSILLHLTLLGCVLYFTHNKIVCDEGIEPYVNKFLKEAKARKVKYAPFYLLFVRFSDELNVGVAGVSVDSYSKHNKYVYISRGVWMMSSEEQRQQLIAHELGHAILHRAHTEELLPDSSPKSIMFPSMLDPHAFSRNAKHYWTELFSRQEDL